MNQLLQISACAVTLLLSTSFMAQGQVKEDSVAEHIVHGSRPGKGRLCSFNQESPR